MNILLDMFQQIEYVNLIQILFKTPPNSDDSEIKILIDIDKPDFDISTQNLITITIWVKYFE